MDEIVQTLVRRYFDAVNAGDEAGLDAVLANDYIQYVPGGPHRREAVKRQLATYRSGFPDLRVHVEAWLGEGGSGAVRTVTEGTHTGEFMGHAPTGRRFRVGGMDLFHTRQGRLAEHWGVFDTLGMLIQLGLYRPVPPRVGE